MLMTEVNISTLPSCNCGLKNFSVRAESKWSEGTLTLEHMGKNYS